MKAIVLTRHGDPSVLRLQTCPAPTPGAGQVLIDVTAAGVSFGDVMARLGLYPGAPKPPFVPGSEVAGTIAALGPDVKDVRVGQRVAAACRHGGYAEQALVDARDVIALPDTIAFTDAAALPLNYPTAWAALVRIAHVQPGERVLVHAAAGGVGIAATQLAKHLGAEVWGTASAAKHQTIQALGVDHPVDYHTRRWTKTLPALDVVLDPLGGASLRTSLRLLRPGGRLIVYGALSAVQGPRRNPAAIVRTLLLTPRLNPLRLIEQTKIVAGFSVQTYWNAWGHLQPLIAPLTPLLHDGTIAPVIAQTLPLEAAADAHRHLVERRTIGKLVLRPAGNRAEQPLAGSTGRGPAPATRAL